MAVTTEFADAREGGMQWMQNPEDPRAGAQAAFRVPVRLRGLRRLGATTS